MRLFQRLWNSLLCTLNPRKKSHRQHAKALAALRWAVLETLEVRTLFSTLYYDTSATAGLQAGSATWDLTATNWNTAADGSGSRVAWTNGNDAVFSTAGTSTVTISGAVNAHSITFAGSGYTVTGGTLTLTGTGSVTMNANGVIASAIGGSAGLSKSGASALTLSGVNSYTGGTNVSAGILKMSGSGTLGATSGALAITGGTLDMNGTSQSIDSLNGTGGIVDNAASTTSVLTVGSGNGDGSFGGVISNGSSSGTVALTKVGTGTQTLTGSNSYGGTTTISAGTLQAGGGGTTGVLGTGGVVDNATLAFNRSNSYTVANAISGSGALVQNSLGTIVLTGANSYSGTTTINSGTLQVGNSGTTGTLGTAGVVDNRDPRL